MPVKRRPLNDDTFADIASTSDSAIVSSTENATMLSPDEIKPPKRDDTKARAHVSVYLAKGVHKAVKRIALEHDMRAHDVHIEGLRLVLEKYGYDFDREARRR